MKLRFCIFTLFSYTTLHFITNPSRSAALQSEQSTCTSQSQCLTTNIQQVILHDTVQYQICLIYNATLSNCQAQTPIDYSCSSATGPIIHALKSNEAICHLVKCNEYATFGIKDGKGCELHSDLTDITLGSITGITCNYPSNGINYCKSKSYQKQKECIWTIPAPQCTTTNPTSNPSDLATTTPTATTNTPSNIPTVSPSNIPTKIPSNIPSIFPTNIPSFNPSVFPTHFPSYNPSEIPTLNPSFNPTATPSELPTHYPSKSPTYNPTSIPSASPTKSDTVSPTNNPSETPTSRPTRSQTKRPTDNSTDNSTNNPTEIPTTPSPTNAIGQVKLLEGEVQENDNILKKNEFDQNENVFESNNDNTLMIVGATAGGAICVFLIVFGVCWIRYKLKDTYRNYDRNYGIDSSDSSDTDTDSVIGNEFNMDSSDINHNNEDQQLV